MANIAEQQDMEQFYTDLSVGEILRRARVHYNLTLEQVEGAIRVRAIQLDAIEQMDIERLPGRVYAIGFVRTYAEYLGLDGNRMVHLFKTQSIGHQKKEELHFPVMARDGQLPGAPLVLGGLVGAILLIFAWSLIYKDSASIREDIPPVPADTFEESITEAPPIGIEQTVKVDAPSNSALDSVLEPATPDRRVIFKVEENSWVEIRNTEGAVILRRILKAGDEYLVPEQKGLVMATGNAGGFKILIDGKEIPKLGRSSQVRRNISLDPQELLKNIEN